MQRGRLSLIHHRLMFNWRSAEEAFNVSQGAGAWLNTVWLKPQEERVVNSNTHRMDKTWV